jgi:hypothetical protein
MALRVVRIVHLNDHTPNATRNQETRRESITKQLWYGAERSGL